MHRGIAELGVEGDTMNWVLRTDGKQYEWVTEKYAWGLGYLTADGTPLQWIRTGKGRYKAGDISISVKRSRMKDGDLEETYIFKNTGKKAVALTNIGIYTPWNDNYPEARVCMTSRCNTHIWNGGEAACAFLMPRRVNGETAHYYDAYANDQDFALMFYMLVNTK